MRVTPVGLLDVDLDTLAGLAQLQAGLTHGHPTGLAASELTAYAVFALRGGATLPELPALLVERARSQRRVYRERWLGDLWQRPGVDTPEDFIARGWDECLAVLGRLTDALDDGGDPCRFTGEGWVAEEALATALLCAVRHADEPVAALARGATTAGDSDSIAALAGAFVGAAVGMAAWPPGWVDRIEYADQLATLGAAWD
jgi:ADP-ribosylglycohydrolase